MASAPELLSYVLTEAREMLDRSPEQVGATIGVSGRTIRRMEDPGHGAQPRKTTLNAVASFYGLDAHFIAELAGWEGSDDALLDWMRERAGSNVDMLLLEGQDEALALAKWLARGAGAVVVAEFKNMVTAGPGSGKTAQFLQMLAYSDAVDDEADEFRELAEAFVGLDRRRRRLALALVAELLAARDAERADEG